MKPASLLLCALIRAYQLLLSPVLSRHSCRYLPSCSAYAMDAITVHGPLTGLRLAIGRLARCHPWAEAAYDPVPPKSHSHSSCCSPHP